VFSGRPFFAINVGKPVDLAERYFLEGADEITFLNITSFRSEPVADIPMMELLEKASRSIFVPLCIGGGIRDLLIVLVNFIQPWKLLQHTFVLVLIKLALVVTLYLQPKDIMPLANENKAAHRSN